MGWANAALLEALAPQLAAAGSLGHTCALIDVEPGANGLYRPRVGGGGGSGVGGGGSLGGSLGGGGVEGGVNVAATLPRPAAGTRAEGVWRGAQQATAGVQLAPEARSEAEATRLCAALVEELMGDGFIPEASKRGEEQQEPPAGSGGRACGLLVAGATAAGNQRPTRDHTCRRLEAAQVDMSSAAPDHACMHAYAGPSARRQHWREAAALAGARRDDLFGRPGVRRPHQRLRARRRLAGRPETRRGVAGASCGQSGRQWPPRAPQAAWQIPPRGRGRGVTPRQTHRSRLAAFDPPLQARRASSKPTYPGLIDQMVAGGVSAGLSFTETMRKECEEEASLPPDVVSRVRPAGLVSYRYDTRKGLSTKLLAVYDAEMPQVPIPPPSPPTALLPSHAFAGAHTPPTPFPPFPRVWIRDPPRASGTRCVSRHVVPTTLRTDDYLLSLSRPRRASCRSAPTARSMASC